MKIIKDTLTYKDQKTHAFYFLPDEDINHSNTIAVFTHGYTSDKSSILTWPMRLAEIGIASALFDLPGHYLGNFSEVLDFNYFKENAHKLFLDAFYSLKQKYLEHYPLNEEHFEKENLRLVLGGHSLGAMLSIKALALSEFSEFNRRSVSVGLGMAPINSVHLFDTPFYKATLNARAQFVSKELHPDLVFPWIKEEKEKFNVSDLDIHLITGEDDLVVGRDGMERFKTHLESFNNNVTMERPTKLPHHEPQLAAPHIKKYLKTINWV